MNQMAMQALRYVRNTGGGATVENFVEDHEPVGTTLWAELNGHGWVEVREGHIRLTPAGEAVLRVEAS